MSRLSRKGILGSKSSPDEERSFGERTELDPGKRGDQTGKKLQASGLSSIPEVATDTDGGRKVDLDDLFPYIGEFGKYQKLLTWLIVLPACIPCGLQAFNQIFMTYDLPHWCRLPEILFQKTNFTLDQLKALALPESLDGNGTSQCTMRDINWSLLLNRSDETGPITAISSNSFSNGQITDFDGFNFSIFDAYSGESVLWNSEEFASSKIKDIPCNNGWDYDISEVPHSVVKDFNLVCGKEIYPTVALILFNVAGLFGVFLFGLLSDMIGRKLAFFACLTCEMIGGIGCVFAPDFWTWTAFRMVTGLTVPAIYQIPFIICLELVGPTYRAFVTVMTSLFYVFGLMLLPLIAYLERDWRRLSLYTTVPFALYYAFYWFLPESPRWLLAENKVTEALKILEHLTKVNGNQVPTQLLDRIRSEGVRAKEKIASGGHHTRGIMDLFRTPNMRLKTCLLTFCWFSGCTVYVGLSFYGPALGDNPYFSFFLGSAIELPGYILCWIVMDRIGRRWPLSICMIVGGAAAIATTTLPPESTTLLMIFYLIAKFGISASYLIIYPFAGELYPTEVRGIGLGFSAYIGGVGLICVPLINYLGRTNSTLPLVVMGGVSVMGGIAGLRLPETLNSPLPQTVEEGEEFGKNFTWQDFFQCGSKSDSYVEDGEEEDVEGEGASYPGGESICMRALQRPSRGSSLGSRGLPEDDNADNTLEDYRRVDQVPGDRSSSGPVPSPPSELTPLRSRGSSDGGEVMSPSTSFTSPGGTKTRPASRVRRPSEANAAQRRKRLVRQGSSTMEAPTDSTGAIIITPWW